MRMTFASWPTTAIALQKLFDVCFEYSIANDLLFNPVKSVCIVFKPCRFKLYCPTVSIGTEPLTYRWSRIKTGYLHTRDFYDMFINHKVIPFVITHRISKRLKHITRKLFKLRYVRT